MIPAIAAVMAMASMPATQPYQIPSAIQLQQSTTSVTPLMREQAGWPSRFDPPIGSGSNKKRGVRHHARRLAKKGR